VATQDQSKGRFAVQATEVVARSFSKPAWKYFKKLKENFNTIVTKL
jgi:hypothetical protein